jgi:hypothetical protein
VNCQKGYIPRPRKKVRDIGGGRPAAKKQAFIPRPDTPGPPDSREPLSPHVHPENSFRLLSEAWCASGPSAKVPVPPDVGAFTSLD